MEQVFIKTLIAVLALLFLVFLAMAFIYGSEALIFAFTAFAAALILGYCCLDEKYNI